VNHTYIDTAGGLREFCDKIIGEKSVAFDTEFVSEHTFRPVLCLIQVAAGEESAVIDPIAIGDVTPFWEAVAQPGHETVVHAGRGEVEFCLRSIGRPPANLFDVQIAAGLAGAEYPAGLASLISKFLGRRTAKHETRTDWRRRPLSKRQIEYAVADARWLPPLRDAIRAKLVEFGRLDWFAEETDSWMNDLNRSLSKNRWRRLLGNASLDAREQAVVRELFHWREGEARRRDCPARRVLRDDLIVELARRGSADPKRIGAVRGLERGDLKRRINDLAEAVRRGLDNPESEADAEQRPREHNAENSVLGQFLFAALGSLCREAQLAPNMVGTPGDIRNWMAHRARTKQGAKPSGPRRPENPDAKSDAPAAYAVPKLARGWRAEFVGRLFDDLLDGKKSIRVGDPDSEHPLVLDSIDPTS